jgi:hypothetical protein
MQHVIGGFSQDPLRQKSSNFLLTRRLYHKMQIDLKLITIFELGEHLECSLNIDL